MVDTVNMSGPVSRPATIHRLPAGQAPEQSQQTTLADVPNLVRQAAAIADQGPPVDYVKLAQIRTAIFRGDYPIDSRAIANAIALQAHT